MFPDHVRAKLPTIGLGVSTHIQLQHSSSGSGPSASRVRPIAPTSTTASPLQTPPRGSAYVHTCTCHSLSPESATSPDEASAVSSVLYVESACVLEIGRARLREYIA